MFHQLQFSMQSKLPRHNQNYHTTGLCAVLVSYQSSATGDRSLCLDERTLRGVPARGHRAASLPSRESSKKAVLSSARTGLIFTGLQEGAQPGGGS